MYSHRFSAKLDTEDYRFPGKVHPSKTTADEVQKCCTYQQADERLDLARTPWLAQSNDPNYKNRKKNPRRD